MGTPSEITDTIVDARAHADGRIYQAYKRLRAYHRFALIEAEGDD